MKLTHQEILAGQNMADATEEWDIYTVPNGSNRVIELDAYGIYSVDAMTKDIFIREAISAVEAATLDCDGYGLHVVVGEPSVFVGQWGYGGSCHIAAEAQTSTAKLRILKIGSRIP